MPRGEWGRWVEENAGVEMRTAQQMIRSYERFGGMPSLAELDRTKLYRLTALPPGTEEAFMEEHDVNAMSTREIERAVGAFKAEMQAEIDREREARMAAERRAEEAESAPERIPDEVNEALLQARREAERKDDEIKRLADFGRTSLDERRALARENAELKREILESQDMLREQQAEIDRVQGELLDLQSARARGDEGDAPREELTLDALSGAVRAFMGTCSRMPYMRRTFCGMDDAQRRPYAELIDVIDGWAESAREALSSVEARDVIEID